MTTRSDVPRPATARVVVAGVVLAIAALVAGCTSSGQSGGPAGQRPAGRAAVPVVTFSATAGTFPVCDWAADAVRAAAGTGGVGAVTTAAAVPDARFPDAWECAVTLRSTAVLRVSVQPHPDAAAAATVFAARRATATGADSLVTVDRVGDEAFAFSGFGVDGVTARRAGVVLDAVVVRQGDDAKVTRDGLVAVARRLAVTVGTVPAPAG